MRVWEIPSFGIDHLRSVDRPEMNPGRGQVLIQVRAVSLNYRDLLVIRGAYNPRLPLPRVPGSDATGVVLAVGDEVTQFRPGDRVGSAFMPGWVHGPYRDAYGKTALGGAVDGVLQEQIISHESSLLPVPEGLSFEEAATLPCAGVTAWNALHAGGFVAGDTVLLQGTGGVSIFGLQFARAMGFRTMIISSSDAKLARALELGVDAGLNYRRNPDWENWCREQTGSGVDRVLEVGGAGTLEKSFKAVRAGGRISLIGVLSGTGTVNPLPLLMRNITLEGIFVGSRSMFEAMTRLIAQRQLRPIVDRIFNFAELPDALRYLESGAHFGKVVVRFD